MPFKLDFKHKVLLFDFDGTIVETETLAKEVVDEYFVQKNFPGQVPFSELIVGRPWKSATEAMVEYAKGLGHEIGTADELYHEFRKRYRIRFEKGVRLIPGILEVLPKFKEQARFMGIVTGSEHDEVDALLNAHGLAPFFDRVWAVGDYEFGKPHPSPFLTAMKDIGCVPTDCVVFEDSKAGMESALKAGIPWVQIAHEAHALVPDAGSLLVLNDWKQLLK